MELWIGKRDNLATELGDFDDVSERCIVNRILSGSRLNIMSSDPRHRARIRKPDSTQLLGASREYELSLRIPFRTKN